MRSYDVVMLRDSGHYVLVSSCFCFRAQLALTQALEPVWSGCSAALWAQHACGAAVVESSSPCMPTGWNRSYLQF